MINSGDLQTLANGLFPSGGSEAHLTPEGRDEIRDAIDVILKFWDYRNTKLSLALKQLDKAADEIFRLRAENEKLRADCAPALPSEEEIAWALCCGPKQGHCNASVHADGISPDAYAERNCEGREIREQARAVLALLGKTGGEK